MAGSLHAQTLSVDNASLSFSGQVGGLAVSQALTISSTGGSANFVAVSASPWLKLNGQSIAGGTTPATFTVTADPTGLLPGIFKATIAIQGGTGPSVSVAVTFTVSTIGASPQNLQFTYQIGGNIPSTQSLTLAGQASYTATANTTTGGSWLSVPPSGNSPGTLGVALNPVIVPGLGAGTYNGTITITPTSGASSAAAVVPVTLTVTPAAPVSVSPSALAINFQIGGTNNQPQQALTISAGGAQPLNFVLVAQPDPNPLGAKWLTVNGATQISGIIPANGSTQVTVAYDTSVNLPAGTYNGTVTLVVSGGSPPQTTISVKLLVSTNPLLSASAAPVFNYHLGDPPPAPQNVTVTSTSSQLSLGLSASTANNSGPWLIVPATASTGTAFAVLVNPTGLLPGTYNGNITVNATGAANAPLQIPVTLKVTNEPLLVTSVSSLAIPYQIGQAAPAAQTINVTSSTGAALNYAATASTTNGGSWLALTNTISGLTDGTLGVLVNPAGLGAGAYNGTISITATNAATGVAAPDTTIPVTLFVSNSALLVATPAGPVTLTAPLGGQSLSQTVTLTSTSPTDQLIYNVTSATTDCGNWLFVTPASGSTSAGANKLTISALSALISARTCHGTAMIAATGPGGAAVANSPMTIPIALQVTSGTLKVDQASLSFAQILNAPPPAAQTISVSSAGQALIFTVATNTGTATWLSATPSSGTTSSTITVSADGSKLTPGTYTGAVIVTARGLDGSPAGSTPATVPVILTVNAGTISAAPDSLTFTQAMGGAAPAPQSVTVSGAPGPINFTVSAAADNNGTWLAATPASGTTQATIQVSANAGSLAAGSYKGTVTIAATGATGSPKSIPVTLNVIQPQTIAASSSNLTFAYTIGLSAPQAQTVQLTSTGGSAAFSVTARVTSGAWLQVSPASGSTPGTLTVNVTPQGLAAGNYDGTITISSPTSLNSTTVGVRLTVAAVPTPVIAAASNAASYTAGAVSPGENIVIFGTGVGPSEIHKGQVTNGKFDTTVEDTQVTFDGTPAPIIYVSAAQTSVMVPYEVAGRPTTTMRVVFKGVSSDPITYNVQAAAPGIYTLNQQGSGQGAILNQDGFTVNAPNAPAAKLSIVSVYMTGEGQTNPGGVTGAVIPSDGSGLKTPQIPVAATVAGLPASVKYRGSAPGIVSGVMQVNVEIPANAPSGAQPIVITLGTSSAASFSTQAGVTVSVQ